MIIDWSSHNGRGIQAEGLVFVSVFTAFSILKKVITRLSLDGYGVSRTGDFSGKAVLVQAITRLGLDAYGVARTGDFSGKPLAEILFKDHRGFLRNVGKLMR